jgi:beta-lactamase superfamily II metal-dependent hydrolase
MFTIQMLPAAEGDCFWIEYGDKNDPYRILIDTGTPSTSDVLSEKIVSLRNKTFELFVVSHIDNDHIGGAIPFLENPPGGVKFKDVWFNGFRHLVKAGEDKLGVKQGQELTQALVEGRQPWNKAFSCGPVVVPKDGPLPVCELEGSFKLTLLSPYSEQLEALLPDWEQVLIKLRKKQPDLVDEVAADHLGAKLNIRSLAESEFTEDAATPNGSSIAFLAEYGTHAVLFGADAFPSVIERSVDRLLSERKLKKLPLNAFKVCHHGSRRNTSPTLPAKLEAERYLISTDGTRHEHPNREGIARLIFYGEPGSTLVFNYHTDYTRIWNDTLLKKDHKYKTAMPDKSTPGMLIDLG